VRTRRRTFGAAVALAALSAAAAWIIVSRDTGTLVRTVALRGQPSLLAVDPRSGHVFVLDHAATTVTMLDGRDGTVLRTTPVPPSPVSIAVDAPAARVVVTTEDYGYETAAVLDSGSGRLLTTTVLSAGTLSTPTAFAFAGAALPVLVADAGGAATLLDPWSGVVRRSIADVSVVAVDPRAGRFVTAVADGTLTVRDGHSGAPVSAPFSVPQGLTVMALDAGAGHLFAANHDDNAPAVVVLDARSGAAVRTAPLTAFPSLKTVAVEAATGRVFVLNGDPGGGAVSVLDRWSGRLVATVSVGGPPTALALDDRTRRAFVARGDGETVSVLDARSGVVQRVVRVVPGPQTLAVDPAAGRVFVTIAGGRERVVEPDPWQWVPGWVPRGLQRWLPFLPPSGSHARTITVPPGVAILDEARL